MTWTPPSLFLTHPLSPLSLSLSISPRHLTPIVLGRVCTLGVSPSLSVSPPLPFLLFNSYVRGLAHVLVKLPKSGLSHRWIFIRGAASVGKLRCWHRGSASYQSLFGIFCFSRNLVRLFADGKCIWIVNQKCFFCLSSDLHFLLYNTAWLLNDLKDFTRAL